jgi:Mg2+/Co2+ transporter CorB
MSDMRDVRDADLPDLVAGVIEDARDLVEAQVSSIKTDLGDRLGELGSAIKSWLVAVCVAIVTTVLLGISIAATLTEVAGVPWYVALWIVTAIAVAAVVALVYRARAQGRIASQATAADVKQIVQAHTN